MTAKKKRVGIIGIYHESNTFIPTPTTLDLYRSNIFLVGEAIREKYRVAHHEISGFFEVLEEADFEAVPIVFAHASPWGMVTDEALDTIWQTVLDGLKQAGKLDGILAAPHGAGVNESRHDMDGWWLSELRKLVGSDTPIIATMDPHVNFSPLMVSACDAAIAYRENPHLDQKQRGVEAARLMVATLRGEIKPVAAGAFPPIAINIERQLTWAEPMQTVQRKLDVVRAQPGILSASITLGFPYADVPEMGSAFVVVADNDAQLAQEKANELSSWLVENRELFRGELISPESALSRVASSPRPVGFLDMGDNMGGGGPADSTLLARLCLAHGGYKTFVCLADAESVEQAVAAGVGAKIRMQLGGKLPMTPDKPIEADVEIISIHDGIYTETQPRHGGKTGGNMGTSVVVKTENGLTALLTTRRTGPASLQPLLSCGIQPADFDIIIIKGVHAPVGAYAEACPTLIRVNTPGVTTADMQSLTYHHRRKPLFPFEEIV